MTIIPCEQNAELRKRIEAFTETLKTQAHLLGDHGLDEAEFYNSGLFRGAIERIRGQFSATMREKREFVSTVLNHLQDKRYIQKWESAGENNRHDYSVTMTSGKIAAIELKGCLDGNNTNIFERPPHAHEFILWSVCTNPGADPRHNVWSGIHTRLSAEIISRAQRIDGLIVWDMVCGTIGRLCPKIIGNGRRVTEVGPYRLPPPCIYLFPATVPAPRNNPAPQAQALEAVELLAAFNACFNGEQNEINSVDFEVMNRGADTLRTTRVSRGGNVVQKSAPTAIRRS